MESLNIVVRIIGLFIPTTENIKRFAFHRLLGFAYLCQWAGSLYLYTYDYDRFLTSRLTWMMPLVGVLQSATSWYYFSFLPKKQADPGYNSDKSALSYNFVKENIFFAGLLLFQCLYYDESTYPIVKSIPIFEYFMVFLPYTARSLFPQTSFRDSLKSTTNKSKENFTFYKITTWITKGFYIWAKHFIGFYLNYIRFTNRINQNDIHEMWLLLIWSGFATTISMFLHTLKFKRIISGRTSYLIYMASYFATFVPIVTLAMRGIYTNNIDLVILTTLGVLVNFKSRIVQHLYQIFALCVLLAMRYNYIETQIGGAGGSVIDVIKMCVAMIQCSLSATTLNVDLSVLSSIASNSTDILSSLSQKCLVGVSVANI